MPETSAPRLSLSVQYATPAPELPRDQLRRWATRALTAAAREHDDIAGASLTLRIVDADEGRSLNQGYRERDYATNVLTFEYGEDADGLHHGDIVLCLPVLVREAQEQGKTLQQHAAHLTVHGVLHALGYDHIEADEAAAMEALEVRVLTAMGLPDPYA